MQELPHRYVVSAAAGADGDVELTAAGLPALVSAPPAEFGGSGDRWSPETLLTVSFAEHGGKTRLTVHQAVFESVTARDLHNGGWSSSLDRLAEFLAKA